MKEFMQKIEEYIELQELIDENKEFFKNEFHKAPDFIAVAPGRINIIGEHTDYNQGLAMPAGINRWILIGFSLRKDKEVHIKSQNFKSDLDFFLNQIPELTENWQKYIYGAFSVFKETARVDFGFDAFIWGNVPIGSGVSSSAALEVAMVNGLRSIYENNINDLNVVKICQQIEHEYLNVKSGMLDQYTSQFSQEGKIMLLDFKSLNHEYIDAEMDDWNWVLTDTQVRRELSQSKYTERVNETSEALKFLMNVDPQVKEFRDLTEIHLTFIDNEVWKKRLKHYITENRRVLTSAELVRKGDFEGLGKQLIMSHNSLKYDYEVSCKELDFLVHSAITFPYCSGARMMGGGFGGCTISLVRKEGIAEFNKFISDSYKSMFGILPGVESYSIVNGASVFKLVKYEG
jgi:galactokinase